MATMAGAKRKWDSDLDFVPTISDSDDIPDLDAENEESDQDAVAGTEPASKANTERKKNGRQQQTALQTIKSKPKKKKRKKHESSSEDEDEQDVRWTSKGQDDGAFDPDFDFQDFGDGAVTDGFDGWTLPASNGAGKEAASRGADVDEIIRQRRARDEKATENGDGEGRSEDIMHDGEDDEEINGIDHGDDELLAEDAFGMAAPPEDEEDEEDDATDMEGHGRSDVQDQGHDIDGSASDQYEGEEEDIAFPMPEPDEVGDYGGASDEENQDPEVNARRDAFFAPEEKSLDPKKILKTEATFSSMSLSRPILRGLTAVGFTSPTPIQSKTVPVALMGKDVVGGAETGSGKTAAFILPILERLLYRPKKVPTTRVSILMPTRELAVQCYSVAAKLAQYTDITFALIVGGLSLREQEQTLKKRPDIVIATPGRFIDHMRNSASFAVEHLEILVLDEADRMLEDGFADELNEVLDTIPRSRQTMLFSATMTQDVDKLIRVGLNRPVRLMVDAKQQTVSGLVQEFIKLKGTRPEKGEDDKGSHDNRRLATLLQLCRSVYTTQTIVFLPTKSLAHRVKVLFALNNVAAAELHGSLSQEQRLYAIATFRDGRATHLLATDLASRGLDIPRVETIINYTVPTTRESYLHRVGRTARAGRSGVSCTLFAGEKPTTSTKGKQASERALLRPILRLAKSQKALIRTRTLPAEALAKLAGRVEASQEDIDAILKEEKEERLIAQTERDMNKGENMMNHEEEIMCRPRRTWFQTEKDKLAAKSSGKDVRMGVVDTEDGPGAKKQKKRLSGKEKKKLDARDERKSNAGWKKRKDERTGGGVLKALKDDKIKKRSKANAASTSMGDKKKSKTKPRGARSGTSSKARRR